jgi:hypothetical protein
MPYTDKHGRPEIVVTDPSFKTGAVAVQVIARPEDAPAGGDRQDAPGGGTAAFAGAARP